MKKYFKPEMEITEFDIEDVITTSDPDPDPEPEPDPVPVPNNGEGQGGGQN